MADGSLYPAGSGLEGHCYQRIQHLSYGVDDVHRVDGDDGFRQVLVAIVVDADFVDDADYQTFTVMIMTKNNIMTVYILLISVL